MKIEQLQELKDITTKDQLRQLVRENENNIDEFIHIQKYIEEEEMTSTKEIARFPLDQERRNSYIELMYKMSTNGYADTVNLIIKKLQNCDGETIKQDSETENNIYQIIKRIADDIDKNIVCTDEFIENIIDCTITNKRIISISF